jgi:exonuclease VII small subunit
MAVGAVALLAGMELHRQSATVLFVPPRLAALRAHLQRVEDNLMGETGAEALQTAKLAQSLQLAINNAEAVKLRAGAAKVPGLATLQALTTFKPTPQAIRSGPAVTYASAVTVGAARGPVPIDTSAEQAKKSLTAAQRLAANLAKYHQSARRQRQPQTPTLQSKKVPIEAAAPGTPNVNPWLVVPANPIAAHPVHKIAQHPAATHHSVWKPVAEYDQKGKVTFKEGKRLLQQGNKILANALKRVQVHRLRPGQKLPKGAKVLPKGAKVEGHVAMLAGRTGMRVATSSTQSLDGEEGGEEGGEVAAAEATAPVDADGGNSTEVRDEVGETGMTAEELVDFAKSEKAKAKYLLGLGEKNKKKGEDELEESRSMIERGWDKHRTADETWEEAEKHAANSTMFFSEYQKQTALAEAEKEGSMAEKMDEISAAFAKDAEEKHALYEEALGEAPSLDLTPYSFDTGNSTNSTAASGEPAEEPAGEAAV